MKKALFSLALLMSVLRLYGQADQPTYGYNYQAIIRESAGINNPVAANKPVILRFSIQNAANQTLYEEIHAVTTDAFGRVTAVVGAGTPTGTAMFDTLNWAARRHFLDVAVKIGGAADWADLGKKEVVQPPTEHGNIYISSQWPALYFKNKNGKEQYWEMSPGGDFYLYDPSLAKYRMFFNSNGYAGIGTTQPESDFHVNGGIKANLLDLKANTPRHHISNYNGKHLYWEMSGGGEFYLYDPIISKYRLAFDPDGGVGIGTTDPHGDLELKSETPSFHISNNAGKRLYWEMSGGGEFYLYDPILTKYRLFFHQNGRVGIGTGNPQADLDVNGDARVKTLTILGNDRTEFFNTTTGTILPAHTVVVFDETTPGHIRPCSQPYDRKAAGVISDMSDTGRYRPGIIHEQENTKNGSPMAIDGTVEVLALGPIAVGDYLTTSAVPGYAMKAKNKRRGYGAILGKAMTPLAKGEKGKVELWVERH